MSKSGFYGSVDGQKRRECPEITRRDNVDDSDTISITPDGAATVFSRHMDGCLGRATIFVMSFISIKLFSTKNAIIYLLQFGMLYF